MSLRIHIISAIRFYRDGLAQVLETEPGFEVVETSASVPRFLRAQREVAPHVALLDMATPSALGGIRVISRAIPEVKVVALGIPETKSAVIACAEAGVAGYVVREASLEDLIATIRRAARGELHCSARIAAHLLRRVTALSAEVTGNQEQVPLTRRQHQVHALLSEGLSNKEIAGRLGIKVTTAKNHVHAVLEKLGVHSRGQAAAKFRRRGSNVARTGS